MNKFYGDVYIIEYQECGLLCIYLLIFLYLVKQFLDISQIDKIIYIIILIIKYNPVKELTRIVTSIMLYSLYGNINPYLFYISNTRDSLLKYIKRYLRNFLEETSIKEKNYLFYQ